MPASNILERDEEVDLYEEQLSLYQAAQEQNKSAFQLYNFLRSSGASEESCRPMFLGGESNEFARPNLGHNEQRIREKAKRLFPKGIPKQIYLDEDDMELKKVLRDTDIPTADILKEGLRVRQESIELMKMQIEWLRQHSTTQATEEITAENEVSTQMEVPADEDNLQGDQGEEFSLKEWDLYWTDVPWSVDPSHLVHISTNSRAATLKQLNQVARKEISIKPSSVVKALEFYLQQTVLQRATAARLKYVSAEVHDWIKIKRGNDRIPLLVPEEGKAIFFVGGRDEIYRSLPN